MGELALQGEDDGGLLLFRLQNPAQASAAGREFFFFWGGGMNLPFVCHMYNM